MTDESVFRSVKRACNAGLDTITLRKELADRLRPAVAFDAHAFGTTDPSTGLLNHLVADRMPSSLALAYVDELYPTQAAEFTIDAAREGRHVFRAGAESPDVADVQRRDGFRYGIDVLLSSNGSLWGKWCLLREQRGTSDVSRDVALVRRVLPHVTRALQRASLIDAAIGDAHRSLGDAVSGVLVLDARGGVLVRSPSVTPMLEDLADVGVVFDGGVPLSILALASRCRDSARCAHDGVPVTLTLRSRGRSGRWYRVQASLAEPGAGNSSPTAADTVIVVRSLVPREMATMLATLYGLSPREREIVARVVRGETTKEIAAHLEISPHTVKHHLDRACEKAGAHGRRALIARLFHDVYRPTLAS